MVPYVAVMLPVLVGFALLALDGSRRMSLQTQMQAAADSLALAGARELNKQTGAESRAISAMANAHAATKSSNTLFGAGSSPTLDYTFVFYSGLSAASDGIGGSVAIGDSDAKYVAVKITPQTWSTVLPASFLGEYFDQRVRRRRGRSRGLRRDERLFGRANLRLQPLRRERGIDDRRAGDRSPLFRFR